MSSVFFQFLKRCVLKGLIIGEEADAVELNISTKHGSYPQVNVHQKPWKITILKFGKSTVMFGHFQERTVNVYQRVTNRVRQDVIFGRFFDN